MLYLYLLIPVWIAMAAGFVYLVFIYPKLQAQQHDRDMDFLAYQVEAWEYVIDEGGNCPCCDAIWVREPTGTNRMRHHKKCQFIQSMEAVARWAR